jgi:hypothetical protein
MKADTFDLLLLAIEAGQSDTIPLPDGRRLKVDQRKGEARVQIVDDPTMQSAIARARFQKLYGE